jgi:iron complex outermembrane receptor protein
MMFGAATVVSTPAFSAEEESVERIEVTGSSIKRADMEGSLPITNISNEDIIRSGVTSVPDLMAQIPAMQGYTTASSSVGGGGGGTQTASLRDLGSAYTLVLLNGRRMASSGSGSSVDLISIPLAAIQRVEILTDGASALYGSDAIAGVVNFIMKSDFQGVNLHARYDRPEESGGKSANFSITGGYGDLASDGYNLMLSYSHDKQDQLKSSERDFAKTGILPFSYQGEDLIFQRTSSNAIPANAYLTFDGLPARSMNPYREANGDQCAPKNAPGGTTCIYDFTETLEIFPESTRDNVFAQALFEINDEMEFYSTASWSKFEMIARIAPYPTGRFTLPLDSQIVIDNVLPHLTDDEKANLTRVSAAWRARPGGNRTTEWATETTNVTAGIRGDFGELSYDLSATYADSTREQNRITGFPLQDPFLALLSSGEVNIFDVPENLSDEANQAVAATMYSGNWETTDTSMKAIEGKASMPVFELPAGDVYIGFGFDYRQVEYTRTTSQANKDAVILFESPTPEFDLSRDTYGMFLEVVAPVFDGFELTGAIRYDNIGKVTDARRASGSQNVNDDVNDTTYKLSAAYRPNDDWLIRASIGTGFKAPSMREIAEPRIEFGVTSSGYSCPFGSGDPLAAACRSEITQYDVFREGYAKLKPETSEQKSVGFVYSPTNSFSFNVDWWQVNLEDQVSQLTQNQIFGDPVTYRDLFTTKIDPGTGDNVLAIIQSSVNIGESNNQGIDWGFDITNEFGSATLKTSFNGTYMIESESLRVGTEDQFDTSLGRFGDNNSVTFRNIVNIRNTLTHGDFAHALNVNYRSGYADQYHAGGSTRIRLASDINTRYDGGVQLNVPSYVTVNYSTQYFVNDEFKVGFGINNLFDKAPPLSLRSGGAGHQVGYDPRYTDVLGRTFYMTADYTF